MLQAVHSGEIPQSQLDASVLKILKAKASVGLNRTRLVDLNQLTTVVGRPENIATVESLGVILSYETNGQSQSLSRTITLLTPGYINITGISTTVLPARPAPGSISPLL